VTTRRAGTEAEGGPAKQTPAALGITERIDLGFQNGLEWIVDHSNAVVAALGAVVLTGIVAAAAYEWSKSRDAAVFDELARIERDLAKIAPVARGSLSLLETQPDAAAAKAAREKALADLTRLADDEGGERPGSAAALLAANLEIDLEQYDAASQRLEKLLATDDDPQTRGTALRLRGFVLEEQGKIDEAAELYRQSGAVEGYLGRAYSYLQAADTYERVGKNAEAITQYQAAAAVAPVMAQQLGLAQKIVELNEGAPAPAPSGAAPAPAPAPAAP